METKICKQCLISKPFFDFPPDARIADGIRHKCRMCVAEIARIAYRTRPPRKRNRNLQVERESQRRARQRTRDLVSGFKKDGCVICGEKHPACLQFHHNDPSQKVMTIQRAVARKMPHPQLIAEIKKCTVLCANCHAKQHWQGDGGNL